MSFVQRDYVVQNLPPAASHPAFRNPVLPRGDALLLLRTFRSKPLHFSSSHMQPFPHPRHLRVQLPQHVSRRHGLLLGFALFIFQSLEQGSELADFPSQRQYAQLFRPQRLFQFRHRPQHIAQLALHRQRTFRPLLPARHRHIVKTFAGLGRKKERIGILKSEIAPQPRLRHDVSIPQLGKNNFQ